MLPFMPVTHRGLRVRGPAFHFFLATAVGMVVGSLAGGPPARAAEQTVLAVVTCDSYADLKKQFGWLGGQVGQPGLAGMLESLLLVTTQGRGVAGLDVKRPLGVVVTTDGDAVAVHGFVPVKSLEKLLDSLQAVTGPTQQSGDARSLTLPSGIAINVLERDGWAIISQQGADGQAIDPAPFFAPLAENYSIGIQLFPHRLPDGLRQQLRMLIEMQVATASERGQQIDPQMLSAAIDGLTNTESLALGIAVDADKDRLFIENRTVALPGTPLALAMTGADKGQLTVPLPLAAEGGQPATSAHMVSAHMISAHLVQLVPEASRREFLNLLEFALPATSNDPLTKTASLLLREVASSVLATGGIDAAISVDPPEQDAGKNGRAVPPVVTAGVRVRDGAELAASVKQAIVPQENGKRLLPAGVEVKFDSGKVGKANLHTITVDLRGTEAAETYGPSLDLTLAIAPEYAFLMAGGDPQQRLASMLGPDGKSDPQAQPIASVDVAIGRVLAYAASQGGGLAEADATAGGDAPGNKESGNVKLLLRPIDRGIAIRLSADGAAMRQVVTATGAGGQEGDGLGMPPGLPIPNGFPIPGAAR